MIKILSRNINGIRAVRNKGFVDIIQKINPDVICLQEPKAFVHQLTDEMQDLGLGYHILRHSGTRPGYAGTCIYTRHTPDQAINHFDQEILHDAGRTTQVQYQGLTIINCYFPNGGTRADGTEMLTYKMNFYDAMMSHLKSQTSQTVILGDFNIAHTELDIARPTENMNTIGFTIGERERLTQFLNQGRVDIYRHLHPNQIEYTRRSVRSGARQRNVGWRLDYACVPINMMSQVKYFVHHTDILGSDHCPVEIWIG